MNGTQREDLFYDLEYAMEYQTVTVEQVCKDHNITVEAAFHEMNDDIAELKIRTCDLVQRNAWEQARDSIALVERHDTVVMALWAEIIQR